MNPIAIVGIYFVVWWLILFAIMPFGMHTQDEEGEVVLGTARSAPVRPNLLKKAIATTIVTTIVVGGLVFAVVYFGITVWSMADWIDLRQ